MSNGSFQPIAFDPPPRPPKRGPGAPKGNMNALKRGGSSKQFLAIAAFIQGHPQCPQGVGVTDLMRRLLPEVIRADVAAQKAARERARQILAPYQPERAVERLAQRLFVAIARDARK